MGENKHIEELDSFTKKLVKQIEPLEVSTAFTVKVMQQIQAKQQAMLLKNEPLISKKMWFIIAVVTGFVLFIPYFFESKKIIDLSQFKFSLLETLKLDDLNFTIGISTITFYAIVFFGLMLSIQIVYLKNYFTKNMY